MDQSEKEIIEAIQRQIDFPKEPRRRHRGSVVGLSMSSGTRQQRDRYPLLGSCLTVVQSCIKRHGKVAIQWL